MESPGWPAVHWDVPPGKTGSRSRSDPKLELAYKACAEDAIRVGWRRQACGGDSLGLGEEGRVSESGSVEFNRRHVQLWLRHEQLDGRLLLAILYDPCHLIAVHWS